MKQQMRKRIAVLLSLCLLAALGVAMAQGEPQQVHSPVRSPLDSIGQIGEQPQDGPSLFAVIPPASPVTITVHAGPAAVYTGAEQQSTASISWNSDNTSVSGVSFTASGTEAGSYVYAQQGEPTVLANGVEVATADITIVNADPFVISKADVVVRLPELAPFDTIDADYAARVAQVRAQIIAGITCKPAAFSAVIQAAIAEAQVVVSNEAELTGGVLGTVCEFSLAPDALDALANNYNVKVVSGHTMVIDSSAGTAHDVSFSLDGVVTQQVLLVGTILQLSQLPVLPDGDTRFIADWTLNGNSVAFPFMVTEQVALVATLAEKTQVTITPVDTYKTLGSVDPWLDAIVDYDGVMPLVFTLARDPGEDMGEYVIRVSIDQSAYPQYTFTINEGLFKVYGNVVYYRNATPDDSTFLTVQVTSPYFDALFPGNVGWQGQGNDQFNYWATDDMGVNQFMPGAFTPPTLNLFAIWQPAMTFTVRHLRADTGAELMQSEVKVLYAGDAYSFSPAQVDGFTATHAELTSTFGSFEPIGSGVMPNENVVVSIYYAANAEGMTASGQIPNVNGLIPISQFLDLDVTIRTYSFTDEDIPMAGMASRTVGDCAE